MKKQSFTLGAIALLLIACSGSAKHVQVDVQQIASANGLIGVKIHSTNGEVLGKVGDIVLDLESGNIQYIILSYEDLSTIDRAAWSGLSSELVPIPWVFIRGGEALDALTLTIDAQIIYAAPTLNPLSSTFDAEFDSRVRDYWSKIESGS